MSNPQDERAPEERLSLADRFWREYQYRNDIFWQILQRSVVFVTALNSVPFLAKQYGVPTRFLYVAPMVAALLTIITAVIMNAEGHKVRRAAAAFRELLRPMMPTDVRAAYFIASSDKSSTLWEHWFTKHANISKNIPLFWCLFGITLSLVAGWVAIRLPSPTG